MAELVVTLKGDGAAPWIVAHGESVTEVATMLDDLAESSAYSVIQDAAKAFTGARNTDPMDAALGVVMQTFPGAQVVGPGPQYVGGGQQLPQQFQPGGGQAPMCMHGPMQYVANGKYGPFWACPLPRDTPGKCKARNAQ